MPRSSTTQSVVNFLRTAMAAQNISQNELARRSGIAQHQISLLLRKARVPRIDTLEKIAAGLGVPVAYMLTGAATTATALAKAISAAPTDRAARMNEVYGRCADSDQRLLLELAERLAAKGKTRKSA